MPHNGEDGNKCCNLNDFTPISLKFCEKSSGNKRIYKTF